MKNVTEQNGTPQNPYDLHADQLRRALADPTVNVFEHRINWPRFKTLLPRQAKRILDFGCGPGNFTQELHNMYPKATILGVDQSATILPPTSISPDVRFEQWDGLTPIDLPKFDLIVAKMVLQYLPDDHYKTVTQHLLSLLAPNGTLAITVPHPYISREFVEPGDNSYVAEIGKTGIDATMFHRNRWLQSFLEFLPDTHTLIIDEPIDEHGDTRRLNAVLCPVGKPAEDVFRRLQKFTKPDYDLTPKQLAYVNHVNMRARQAAGI